MLFLERQEGLPSVCLPVPGRRLDGLPPGLAPPCSNWWSDERHGQLHSYHPGWLYPSPTTTIPLSRVREQITRNDNSYSFRAYLTSPPHHACTDVTNSRLELSSSPIRFHRLVWCSGACFLSLCNNDQSARGLLTITCPTSSMLTPPAPSLTATVTIIVRDIATLIQEVWHRGSASARGRQVYQTRQKSFTRRDAEVL